MNRYECTKRQEEPCAGAFPRLSLNSAVLCWDRTSLGGNVQISVIIPTFNAERTLADCLHALDSSTYSAAECIVVDDGSTDQSVSIAKRAAAKIVSTGGRFGPARARNLGVQCASGDLVVFIDADVALQADALKRVAARFEAEKDLDALIGAYDDAPSDQGVVSQFKNLQHSFVHSEGNHRAFTFWSGCGAVKRDVFLQHGGFDESYEKPSIEDIELGYRMRKAGRKIALDPLVRCKHMKVWTLGSLLLTDVFQRGIPWTVLIFRTRCFPDDLNLRWGQRASVLLAGSLVMSFLSGIAAAILGQTKLALWAAAMGIIGFSGIVVLNHSFYNFLAARRGLSYLLFGVPLHLLYYFYSGVSFLLGIVIYKFKGAQRTHSSEAFLHSSGNQDRAA
jgi:glycosyltransferase involved in cell wall biosynthesis